MEGTSSSRVTPAGSYSSDARDTDWKALDSRLSQLLPLPSEPVDCCVVLEFLEYMTLTWSRSQWCRHPPTHVKTANLVSEGLRLGRNIPDSLLMTCHPPVANEDDLRIVGRYHGFNDRRTDGGYDCKCPDRTGDRETLPGAASKSRCAGCLVTPAGWKHCGTFTGVRLYIAPRATPRINRASCPLMLRPPRDMRTLMDKDTLTLHAPYKYRNPAAAKMASTPPILLSSWGAMLSIPVAACLLIGLLAAALRFLHRRKSIGHVRGPPASSTLLGHEYELNQQDQVGDLEDKWLKEYGPTWRIGGTFATDILMTADPKALQHIFHKSAYNYAKRASQNQMSYVLAGPNIAWVQGEDHHRHRKIMNPAFNAGQLRSFLPLFQRITGKLVEKWKTELATANESEMMVNNWLSRTTLDIVGEAAFDYNYNALEDNQESALAKAYHGILKDIEFRLPAATTLFRATWDYVPNSVLKLCRYIPVEPFTRISHLRRTYDNYGTKMLREKRTGNDVGEQTRGKDVMSILIKANASSDAKMRLDDEELMAQMFILTLAGHETTAVSFSFLLYELARHPEYQERMREEIMSARARLSARGGVDFTMEELDNMPLCLNAIKESLRLHPIATGLPRVATKDDVLPLAYPIVSTKGETITEIPISKGQVILTSFYAYNRLPQVWGEDADIFNPDRFSRIDTIGKQTNVGVFANLMTFSAGVRACIGWRFSVIEMQSLAAELIGTFKFSLPTGPNAEKEVQCAPAGTSMVPLIRGKPELGPALRLRVGLAH